MLNSCLALSSLQFKHIDGGQNWYRRGELNLPTRIEQVLELQPDFVEIITWNDSGESHYIGNCWPEAISGAPAIQAYSNGFDHTAWQDVLAPFISAYVRCPPDEGDDPEALAFLTAEATAKMAKRTAIA